MRSKVEHVAKNYCHIKHLQREAGRGGGGGWTEQCEPAYKHYHKHEVGPVESHFKGVNDGNILKLGQQLQGLNPLGGNEFEIIYNNGRGRGGLLIKFNAKINIIMYM